MLKVVDNAFSFDIVSTPREKLLAPYVETMVDIQSKLHPHLTKPEIEAFVKEVIKKTLNVPMVDVLVSPTPGNREYVKIPLTDHYGRNIANNIILPSGTAYCQPDVRESFLKVSIRKKLKLRKVYKGQMLTCKEKGDTVGFTYNNNMQYSTKVFANSIPGGMNSEYNILYNKPGFNSITSGSRSCVKTGYGHTERFVAGNVYLKSYDDAIAYCSALCMVMNPNHELVCEHYNLYIPSRDDLMAWLESKIQYYTFDRKNELLHRYVDSLTPHERAWIVYAGSLYNLVVYNRDLFSELLTDLFNVDGVKVDEDITPKSFFKFDGALQEMVASLYHEVLGVDDKGKPASLDYAQENDPEKLRILGAYARHVENVERRMYVLYDHFFKLQCDLPRISEYQNIVRNATIVSDTDSVIFTAQLMIELFVNPFRLCDQAYKIGAYTVYLVSRTLRYVFYKLSSGFGIRGEDTKMIAMKNEYTYPLFLAANVCKHYGALNLFQEGKYLHDLPLDLKGLGFRSSTLTAHSLERSKGLIRESLLEIMDSGDISATDVLTKVYEFEKKVYLSLLNGELEFCQRMSVKSKAEYPEPMKTMFFYADMWNVVFGPLLDEAALPNKMFKLPLKGEGKILKDPKTLSEIYKFDQGIHRRLHEWQLMWPDKKISMILLPPHLQSIPEFLRPLIDHRAIVYKNSSPQDLTLSSLKLSYASTKENFTVYDYFRKKGDPELV